MQYLAWDLDIFRLSHSFTKSQSPTAYAYDLQTRLPLLILVSSSHDSHTTNTLPTQPNWHYETAPLSVSYTRQDFIARVVILPVILYIRQPLVIIDSVLGDFPAMPRKTGCPQSCYRRFAGCPPALVLRAY